MNQTASTALDMAVIMPWVTAAIAVITLGTLLKNIFGSGAKETALKIELLEKKLIDHDRRIQSLEGEMKHMPSKENVHKQQLDITEMKGEMGVIKKSIETTERTTRRVEEFLLKSNAA